MDVVALHCHRAGGADRSIRLDGNREGAYVASLSSRDKGYIAHLLLRSVGMNATCKSSKWNRAKKRENRESGGCTPRVVDKLHGVCSLSFRNQVPYCGPHR